MSNPELTPLSSSPLAETPSPARPTNFFRGPNGIRAGWRVLIFLLIFAGLVGVLFVAVTARSSHAAAGMSQLTPLGLGETEGILFLSAAIAALIMARIEHRKFGQYGLPLRSALGKDFWIGLVVGFTAITGALLGISLFHGFRINGLAIRGSAIVSAWLAWGVAFLIVGLAEEFCFRGYLQFTLTTGMGFWPAAILMSVLFGAAHGGNPGESLPGLVSVVLFAILFCLFLRRRGNLWWAVGFHAGWDWGQTFFYGVSDSGIAPYHNLFNSQFAGAKWLTGGTVGPEASLFTPIVLALVAIGFASVYRENRYTAI